LLAFLFSHSEIILPLSTLLGQVCTAHAKQIEEILMSLNSMQKSLCQMATT